MSTDTTADLKVGHTQAESSGTNTIVADLQCDGWGGWDARDVLAGRIDDATTDSAGRCGYRRRLWPARVTWTTCSMQPTKRT